MIHAAGGVLDCHLMVSDPAHHFPEFAESGADSVTFHVEATDDPAGVAAAARAHGLAVGVAFNPGTEPAQAAAFAGEAGAEHDPLHEHRAGLLGAAVHAGRATGGSRSSRASSTCRSRSTAAIGEANATAVREAGASLLVAGSAVFADPDPAAAYSADPRRRGMSLDRALELAEAALGVAYPNPTVGAVVVAGGAIVGEGVTEAYGGRHGEVVALAAAGERARGRHALRDDGAVRPPRTHAAVRRRDRRRGRRAGRRRLPRPEPRGGRRARAAARGRRRGRARRPLEARRQNEAWRTWTSLGRPFVTYKVAITLDGRVTVPGHALGDGRGVAPARPRAPGGSRTRSRSGWGPCGPMRRGSTRGTSRSCGSRGGSRSAAGRCPPESELELRAGALADELDALAAEGVQSLLLEGGPTLATAFLEAGLVDKLLVFVAPTLSGDGPRFLGELPSPRPLLHVSARPIGADVLVEAYLREPEAAR